ncbi:MAG: response regulator [Clostridiaceae bacterium]
MKVLIVDDAAFIRFALRQMLEKNGIEVVGEAANGREGIEKYSMCKPDLVTMDITMPEMNGIESLKEIKKLDPNAKVLMISAMGQETMVKDAIINGAINFIVKPFEEQIVMKAINRLR